MKFLTPQTTHISAEAVDYKVVENDGVKSSPVPAYTEAIAHMISEEGNQPRVIYRVAGENTVLIEYGDAVLNFSIRFRVHRLEQKLRLMKIKGVEETAPGIRSLWIKYDPLVLPLKEFITILDAVEKSLPQNSEAIPSRKLTLPIAFNDKWTQEAIDRYRQSVRKEGPYLPDNLSFIARCNGLSGKDDVIEKTLSTDYMVFGLGDVYLGAPCAVPLDPRCRLVVPKYNPARTWTPEGGVGIGGAYLCIYPMESPGGYQLIGRTLPIWNTHQNLPAFSDSPWLLKLFDRIRFKAVSDEEIDALRESVFEKTYEFEIEEGTFDVGSYDQFLASIEAETEQFRSQQDNSIEKATVGY